MWMRWLRILLIQRKMRRYLKKWYLYDPMIKKYVVTIAPTPGLDNAVYELFEIHLPENSIDLANCISLSSLPNQANKSVFANAIVQRQALVNNNLRGILTYKENELLDTHTLANLLFKTLYTVTFDYESLYTRAQARFQKEWSGK